MQTDGSVRLKMDGFDLQDVTIKDAYYENAFKKELSYLFSLEPDRLLAGFYEARGLKAKAERYPGWESLEIQGHTLGHYLTALAQAYASTKMPDILNRIAYILDELGKCQYENGYLFATKEEIFDRLESKKPAWVPWYTMHKILSGLIAAYRFTGLKNALTIASRLGDWVYQRTSEWTEEIHNYVLSVEYGGMNDILYDLFRFTGDKRHLEAAHKFDELPLFEELAEGHDILNDKHANTTIPKFIGALNRYITLKEGGEIYLKAAKNFWDIVVGHHTYITGGNSEWEHFGKPDILDAERTNCNCETCNSYNMLKLSRLLFLVTGDKKYMDYYDITHVNAIMGSQNPETGMTTYFQPMATGYFKVFGTPYDRFWCCTGTGMENFTKLNDSIYFRSNEELVIARYISSELNWKEKGIILEQAADFAKSDKVTLAFGCRDKDKGKELTVVLRKPDWVSGDISVKINGGIIEPEYKDGYIRIKRTWKDKDRMEVTFQTKVRYSSLQDNPSVVAFAYGPYVLCAALGRNDMRTEQTGVSVDIPVKDFAVKDYIVIREGTVKDWLDNIEDNLVRIGEGPEFALKGTDEDNNLTFKPYCMEYKERYGIYWKLTESESGIRGGRNE